MRHLAVETWNAWARATVATAGAMLAGCVGPPATTTCDDGVVCASPQVCRPAGGGCADPAQLAACADLGAGAACVLEGVGAGLCREGLCVVAGCGDGIVDPDEACDDGNDVDDDACTTTCALPTCGDAVVQGSEACDEGDANADDRACTSRCLRARCGDNLIEAGAEACDAGGANADDEACTATCTVATCGDGLVWAGIEACDDGNTTDGDGCRGDCRKLEVCGDGADDGGEACDDGDANPANGCDACVVTAWAAAVVIGRNPAATSVALAEPTGLAVDRDGNLFIADTYQHRVRRVDAITGVASTIAGTGTPGTSGDGGPAPAAQLSLPIDVIVDGAGAVFVTTGARVRRVDPISGIITTVAGTVPGFGGDGGPATSAQLLDPAGLAVDGLGTLYIADTGNHRLRRVDAVTGTISTVAGNGTDGYGPENVLATSSPLSSPTGLALSSTSLFFADTGSSRVRRVGLANGRVATVAGGPVPAQCDELMNCVDVYALTSPMGIALRADGSLLIADTFHHRLVTDDGDGVIGQGGALAEPLPAGFAGDGGPASAALVAGPSDVAIGPDGAIFVADRGNRRIRRIAPDGTIATVVGTGAFGFPGDGGAGTGALLRSADGLARDADAVYVADAQAHQVRRLDLTSGVISALAGDGTVGNAGDGPETEDGDGDGGPATAAELHSPSGLVVAPDGAVLIADTGNHRVRRVDPATGVITTLIGTGQYGFALDGGAPDTIDLALPTCVALAPDGDVLFGDRLGTYLRRLDVATNTVSTVAGNGTGGVYGDGTPAVGAQVAAAQVAVDAAGHVYVASPTYHRVRRIDAGTGLISTFFGDGIAGGSGDGGPASAARLHTPAGLAIGPDGSLLVFDRGNGRVRRVDLVTGTASTVLGAGAASSDGDGGPATAATFANATALLADDDGGFWLGDAGRVRRVADGVITTVLGLVDPEGVGPLAQATLASPVALALAGDAIYVAGGGSGVLELADAGELRAVAGRYPEPTARGALARYRAAGFGDVGGVAVDVDAQRVYLTETTANRVWAIDASAAEISAWTMAPVINAPGTPGAEPGGVGLAASAGRLRAPRGLYFAPSTGTLYVADTGNHAVRALDVASATLTTVVGIAGTLGFFGDGLAATDALLYQPHAVTRCGEDLFVADTGNHRVRRVSAGVIETVLGDGVASSSGQGAPAAAFPVDTPRGLACDPFGNLLVASTTAVRLVVADADGVVDGRGEAQTIYGAPPRDAPPASVTTCVAAVAALDATTVWLTDACAGLLVSLTRAPSP